MQTAKFLALVGVSVLLASCGSGVSGKQTPLNPQPKSPEEAMASLPAKYRAAALSWRGRLVKSCDASDLLGAPPQSELQPETGLDLPLLLEKSGNSTVVAEGNQVVLLGVHNSFAGESTSKFEQSVTIDGKTQQLKVELRRQGRTCTVYLYGQKVYQTEIIRNIEVVGQWSDERKPEPVYRKTSLVALDATHVELKNHALVDAWSRAGLPDASALALLRRRFGVSEALAPKFFQIVPTSLLGGSAARLGTWINAAFPRIVLPTETAQGLLDGAPHSLDVEWRVRMFTVESNRKALAFRAGLTLTKQPDGDGFGFAFDRIKYLGVKADDPAEASTCFEDRVRLFQQVDRDPAGMVVHPSWNESASPCSALAEEPHRLVQSNGSVRKILPELLQHIRPSSATRYGGWEGIIFDQSLALTDKSSDFAAELDPKGLSAILQELGRNLSQLKGELSKTKDLGAASSIYQLGVNWALIGKSVAPARMERIVAAGTNAWHPFVRSTQTLLSELAENPEGSDATIAFALGLDADYKKEAERALAQATELGLKSWYDSYFSQVLQKQIPIETFKGWNERLGWTKTELAKYPILTPRKEAIATLTLHWLESGEISPKEISAIHAALSNAIHPFLESTDRLLSSLGQSLAQSKDALAFAAALTPEYKNLANTFHELAGDIGMESWSKSFFEGVLQNRPTYQQLVKWDGTLKAANGFTRREHERMKGESEMLNESYRKEIVGNALKEIWDAEDFAQLEKITELGKLQLACDRHKGASSIASCVGMNLFSRASRKLFDPALNRRYGPLAQEFLGYLAKLEPAQDYFSVRRGLIGGYFGSFEPIWSECRGAAYDAKAGTLRAQIPAYVKETDQIAKWKLEREIRANLENCRG